MDGKRGTAQRPSGGMEPLSFSDASFEPLVRHDAVPHRTSGAELPILGCAASSSATFEAQPNYLDSEHKSGEHFTDKTAQVLDDHASSRSKSPRARDERAFNDCANTSKHSSTNSADGSAAIRETSSEQQPQVAALELEERAGLMFVVGDPEPVASGRPAALRKATKHAVLCGAEIIRSLCKKHGPQLSASFGNFDQLVGLGWLLADVVLGCLISRADALAIGRKASKMAPDFKKEFAAPATRAGKKRFSSDEERAQAFEAA